MTLPSNMNELIVLIKENWMFAVAFILIMILVDYFIILKRRNRTIVQTLSDEEIQEAEQRLARKREEHRIASIEEFKNWNRQWNSALRIQSFKRKPNYQSRKRRSNHGINRHH